MNRWVLLLTLVFCVLMPRLAHAQPSLGDELAGTAKTDYSAGRVLFDDGNHAAALVKFQSALDQSKDARLLWNIAACHRGLKHYAETIRYLERFKTEAATAPPAQRTEADTIIGALRPYVAAVSVHANEDGASVLLDDRAIGTTPLDKFLVDLGDHRLVVKKQGFADQALTLTIGSADQILDLRLKPATSEGKVSVHAGAGDAIAIDGKTVGVGEWEGPVTSGMHVLTVSASGKRTYESRFVVEVGQVRPIDVKLEPEEKKGLPIWAWVGIGAVAAAGLSILGVLVFSGGSDSQSGQVEKGTIPPGFVQIPARRF